jgi:sporulation protein YlmC with PRC-barrel domain
MNDRPRFKLKPFALAVIPAIALLSTAPASGEGQTASQQGATASGGSSAAGSSAARTVNPARSEIDMRASRLIGMEVRGSLGEELGEIEEVVVDLAGGQARYAVLSAGGFLGIGDRLFTYRLSEFSQGLGGDHLVMANVTQADVKNERGFDNNDWPDFDDPQVRSKIDQGAPAADEGARLRRASELLGASVRGSAGEEIGELQDLTIHLTDGQIRGAWIRIDNGEPGAERLVSVAPSRLTLSGERGDVVVKATRAELEKAPSASAGEGAR